MKKNKIADYAWLSEGRKYYHIFLGNPLCVTEYTLPKTDITRDELIRVAQEEASREKERFTRRFPTIKWEEQKCQR